MPVQDVFFRIGGATAGSATDSYHVVNDAGAAVTAASPGPSDLVSYP